MSRISRSILFTAALLAGAALSADPAAPTGVWAQATGVQGQVSLTWTAVSATPPVSYYNVYYSLAASFDPADPGLTPAVDHAYAATATVSVADGWTYNFWVVSVDQAGVSSTASTALTAWGTPAWAYSQPAAPTITASVLPFGAGVLVDLAPYATGTNDTQDLGALSLEVSNGGAYTQAALIDPDDLPVTLTAESLGYGQLVGAQPLQFRGIAYDSWGDSSPEGLPVALTLTAAPAGLAALGTDGASVQLGWTLVPQATSYLIYQASTAGLPLSLAALTQTTTALTATVSAPAGAPSSAWRVCAVDAQNNTSAASNEVQLMPAPAGLQAQGLPGGKIRLQWQRPAVLAEALTGYAVYRSDGAATVVSDSASATVAWTLTGTVDGVPVSVSVAAVGGGTSTWWTGTASAAVTARSGLALPHIYSVSVSPTGGAAGAALLLSWTASSDAGSNTPVSYSLYAYTGPAGSTDPWAATPRLVAFTAQQQGVDTSRSAAAQSVWYGVSVTDTAGGSSGDPRSGTAGSLLWAPNLAAPQGVTCSVISSSGSRAQVMWSTVTAATGYQVWRATGASGAWIALAAGLQGASDQGQQGWLDLDAVNNTANAYAVQALLAWPAGVAGGGLGSALSNAVTVTPGLGPTMPGVLPGGSSYALTVVASLTNPGSMDLYWSPAGAGSSQVQSYEVRRGYSPDPNAMAFWQTRTAASPASGDLVHVVDSDPPLPYTGLWYGIQARDVNDRPSPGWLTGTAGSPLPWGAPVLGPTRVRVGGVTLVFGPPTVQGTYGNVTNLTYTITRVDYAGAGEKFMGSFQLLALTQTSWTDTTADPNQGTTPTYNIRVTDPVSQLTGPPATVGVGLALPANFTGLPTVVTGLAATVGVSPSRSSLPVHLTWVPAPAAQLVLTYVVRANGIGLTETSQTFWDDATDGGSGIGGSVTYDVTAHNRIGLGQVPSSLVVPLNPPQPTGVAFNGLSVPASLTLGWSDLGVGPGSNVDSYSVYRKQGGPLLPVATGLTVNAWTDSALPVSNSALSYAVVSVVNGYESYQPVTQASLTVPGVPTALTYLAAVAGVNGAALSWSAAVGADAYWVFRSASPLGANPPPGNLIATVPAGACCGYVDASAVSGQQWYAVAGVNSVQEGGAAAASVAAQPGPPRALTAAAGFNGVTDTVTLAWMPPLVAADATAYNVYRATSPGLLGGPAAWVAVTTTAAYVDAGVSTGSAWFYGVSGFNTVESPVTPAAAVTAYAPLTLTVNNLVWRNGGGGIQAWWDGLPPSTGVLGYYASLSSASPAVQAWAAKGVSVAASAGGVFLSLSPSAGPMTLSVLGYNSAGSGPVASQQGVWANGMLQAMAPTGVTATVGFFEAVTGTTRVQLAWNTPSAAVSVSTLIYRSTSPIPLASAQGGSGSPSYLTGLVATGNYADQALTVTASYYYALTNVLTPPGLPAGESNPVWAGPLRPTTLAGPCSLSGSAGDGRVDLQWGAPSSWGSAGEPTGSAAAYLLYRSASSSLPPVAMAGFPLAFSVSQTSYSDLTVANGGLYYYFLRAVDQAGNPSDQWAQPHEAAPNQATVEIMAPSGPLLPPSALSAVASNRQVTLRWVSSYTDAQVGGTYNVYRRKQSGAYGPDALLPWLQRVGPTADDYPSGVNGASGTVPYLVQTLSDPPASGTAALPAPYAPVNKTSYCYSIAVVNGGGEGPRSAEVCAKPYLPLAAPTNVSVTVQAGAVQPGSSQALWVGWTGCLAQPSTDGYAPVLYRVYRSTDGGNTYSVVGTQPDTSAGLSFVNYGLTDTATALGASYLYRVVGVDSGGNEGDTSRLVPAVIPTGNSAIHLFCNAFNPAKGESAPVQYSLQMDGHAWVKVYTISGDYVCTLFDEDVHGASATRPYLSAKTYWNGANSQGQTVASGVYLVHLEAPGFRSNARVAVIK